MTNESTIYMGEEASAGPEPAHEKDQSNELKKPEMCIRQNTAKDCQLVDRPSAHTPLVNN